MRTTVIVVLVLATAAPMTAQSPQTTFRSGIDVVELDVSVTRGGVPVAGLTSRDFELTDNRTRQDVESVTLERVPLNVSIVLDVSQSVAGERLEQMVQAGDALADALRPAERVSLITFSHSVSQTLPLTTDVTSFRAALKTIVPGGSTSQRDAAHLALLTASREGGRPLILLFTDGHDTTSWLTSSAVIDSARRSGIVMHVVRFERDAFLDHLVDATGGRTWSATSNRQLRELFTHALDEMRARYLLTYTPKVAPVPGWHDLKVRLRNGSADVIARPGYFVAAR
jgi:VWFA-related protein